MQEFLKQAISVVPSKRQLDWFATEFYAFIHFGVNTFTDREWGDGKEPESVFAPVNLDCSQWVSAIKAAGMKGMVLTAKHHDGFCLWPSKYTEHSVKNASVKRDIVREAADACRKGGIKFGFYLSPWDRNNALYGTEEYNDYFCNQLTELLTGYGDIFCVWFDNACGEGPNGKKQEYDFKRYFELIRKYQPGAVIFNDFGPDVRWCGNEAGNVRESEWAVVPSELCKYSEVQTEPGPMAKQGDLSFLYNSSKNIGGLDIAMFSQGLTFTPAETNTSIRKGWFWHSKEEPKSLEELADLYIRSVGGNSCLHLNIPPNREGRIDERDVKRLKELGDKLKEYFGHEIPCSVTKCHNGGVLQQEYEITLDKPATGIRFCVIEEELERGQRIESFQILRRRDDLFPIFQGTTIGNRKICVLGDSRSEQNPLLFDDKKEELEKLVLRITSSRGEPVLRSVKIY